MRLDSLDLNKLITDIDTVSVNLAPHGGPMIPWYVPAVLIGAALLVVGLVVWAIVAAVD